ncbi:MAG: serine hydroxymethyltransferase [bacterium]|nr:serine hydroxymethyltransferase [bacterium]
MDSIIANALAKERIRQEESIELIASENYVSNDILKLQGSILTNKYAEGYPDKRYYGGCENIDVIENLAIKYACKLFSCKYANVQPHSGSSANMAVFKALLNPHDKILSMDLNNGGHLTHGAKVSFSGIDYEVINYYLDKKTEMLNYEIIEEIALKEKPKLIIAGASAYSRIIDFARFKEIANKVGALLMVDMAHIAGLVAAGLHPSPFPYADVVTSTTHKTLRGPRGGLILTNDEQIIKKVNKMVFPGIQGGPLEHIIAAKGQCFYEAMQPEFKDYAQNVIKNCKALCNTLKEEGIKIVSGTTDNHLVLVNVKSIGLTGKMAEEILAKINITVNKNMIPGDTENPSITSGLRLGSAAMSSRGLKEDDFINIGLIISKALKNYDDEKLLNELKIKVKKITEKYPLWY